jgi:hypothetical protein
MLEATCKFFKFAFKPNQGQNLPAMEQMREVPPWWEAALVHQHGRDFSVLPFWAAAGPCCQEALSPTWKDTQERTRQKWRREGQHVIPGIHDA